MMESFGKQIQMWCWLFYIFYTSFNEISLRIHLLNQHQYHTEAWWCFSMMMMLKHDDTEAWWWYRSMMMILLHYWQSHSCVKSKLLILIFIHSFKSFPSIFHRYSFCSWFYSHSFLDFTLSFFPRFYPLTLSLIPIPFF